MPLVGLAEAIVISTRKKYDWKNFFASSFDVVARFVQDVLLLPIAIEAPVLLYFYGHRVLNINSFSPWAFSCVFIGQEFFYYWQHRAYHNVRFYWARHSVHHSDNQLSFSTAFRVGIFEKLMGANLIFAPLFWFGFAPGAIWDALIVNVVYQFFIHCTWIPKLGVLEYVLNTPSAHRVHHASNPEYINANYGGTLIIFDRLFGTYVEEREDIPCRYGLVKPQNSLNPLRIELDQWISLFKDILRARSLRQIIHCLIMQPEAEASATAASRLKRQVVH